MLNKEITNNNSTIGDKSCGNTVYQGNIFNMMSPEFLVKSLAQSKNYDALQTMATEYLSVFEQAHPLFPDYKAKFNSDLNRLISSPVTDEALKKYPPSIRAQGSIDITQCEGIDKSETPLEYSYRTQKPLYVKVDSIKEYLGEYEDPFPKEKTKNHDCVMINPPAFPEAIEARLESGDVSIPFLFRRFPCEEFGKKIFGNTSFEHGFDVRLTVYKNDQQKLSITKTFDADLKSQLLREKLYVCIKQTHQVKLIIGDNSEMMFPYAEEKLQSSVFIDAPAWIDYIKNLIYIEEKTGCIFDRKFETVKYSSIRIAYIIANSLKDWWTNENLSFDNEIRCDYNRISEKLLTDELSDNESLNNEMEITKIELQGVIFSVKKCYIKYEHARINNIASVRKLVSKKRKNILITIRPTSKYKTFSKKTIYTDIKVITEKV